MPRSARPQRRLALPALAAAAALAAASGVGSVAAVAPPGGAGLPELGRLQALVAMHPGLNHRALPLATIAEHVAGDGGEAGISAAEEQYADRAYPASDVAPEQQQAAAAAAAQANHRASVTRGTWTLAGPTTGSVSPYATYTGTPGLAAGRTTALAVGPCAVGGSCVLYAGSAGGGVWRTDSALGAHPAWRQISGAVPSQAVGSLVVDPTDPTRRTLYLGTGEPNGSSDSEAGLGLFRSTDGGEHWAKVPTSSGGTDFARDRSIASVVVDPSDAGHLLVGTAVARHGSSSVNGGRFTPPGAAPVALYETRDGGATWTVALKQPSDSVNTASATGGDYFKGGVTQLATDPQDPGTVYAAVNAYGLFRRTGGGSFTQIFKDAHPNTLSSRTAFALAALPGGKTRVYLGDATNGPVTYDPKTGAPLYHSGLFRADDAEALTADAGTHDQWTALSSSAKTSTGYDSYNFCEGQCSYDIVVVSPPGRPDTVLIAGQMNYDEIGGPSNGRAVQESDNAGISFTDLTNDAATPVFGLHPDQHALAPLPGGSVLSASDGGVVRIDAGRVDGSADCATRGLAATDLANCRRWLSAVPAVNTSLNEGLNTLQFQSVSVSPHDGSMLGGTQDNGTWLTAGKANGWQENVGGDGGQSGFDAVDTNVRWHSYYAPQHDVTFSGADPAGWDWASDPLNNSGEAASFYTPLTTDPVVGGTVFDGLQHVWRTTDNGGDRAYLDQNCNEYTGAFAAGTTCGDWQPLGGTAGNLTGSTWGNTKGGGYVVAISRASDHGTAWVATRRGRVFLTQNADAADPSKVSYTRLDTSSQPRRFVSGIVVDPANPLHAWVSFSGYSAYAAGGHVYEVTVNPSTKVATWTDRSGDLGDQPVTALARSASGALFAATDFGVLALPAAGTSWEPAAAKLPTTAVFGLTLSPDGHTLYAATHGRGIWQVRLD